MMQCSHPGHVNCVKYRNIGPQQCARFGWQEPLAYLGAWRSLAAMCEDRNEHVHLSVPAVAVAEYFNTYFAASSSSATATTERV